MAQPPRQIGRWTLGRRLGSGGQASVYQVTSAEGGEVFALKRIRARTAKKLARFEREVQQHKGLSDRRAPNVMPLLEHAIEHRPDGTAEGYIVMPLAVGTLEDSVATFERLQPLLYRIENDEAFASGVLKAFGEDRKTWFGRLPARLAEIRRTFWDAARFDWASISRWPEE